MCRGDFNQCSRTRIQTRREQSLWGVVFDNAHVWGRPQAVLRCSKTHAEKDRKAIFSAVPIALRLIHTESLRLTWHLCPHRSWTITVSPLAAIEERKRVQIIRSSSLSPQRHKQEFNSCPTNSLKSNYSEHFKLSHRDQNQAHSVWQHLFPNNY